MATQELKKQTGMPTRRKFVWNMGIVSAFAALGGITGLSFLSKKKAGAGRAGNKNKMVKMLTHDGKLVEVDETFIAASRRKITDAELQQWIKK